MGIPVHCREWDQVALKSPSTPCVLWFYNLHGSPSQILCGQIVMVCPRFICHVKLFTNYLSKLFLVWKLILQRTLLWVNFHGVHLAAPSVFLHFLSRVITMTNKKQISIISIKDAMLKLASISFFFFSRRIREVIKMSFYLCTHTLQL